MFKLAAVALLAGIAYAQIPGLPECAQGCITNYGGCNQVDVKCICENKPLLETLSCCVSQKCDAAGTEEVIKFADSLCGSYGVTTLPTAASCAATASSTASSGTESSTATVTSAPASASSASTTQTGTTAGAETASTTGTSAAAAAPTHMAQKVLGLGLGAAGLLAVL